MSTPHCLVGLFYHRVRLHPDAPDVTTHDHGEIIAVSDGVALVRWADGDAPALGQVQAIHVTQILDERWNLYETRRGRDLGWEMYETRSRSLEQMRREYES